MNKTTGLKKRNVNEKRQAKLFESESVQGKKYTMKKMLLVLAIVIGINSLANAQRVRVRLDFPVTVAVRPPGPPPFGGAIWIGPEWRWQQNRYVMVPGYWSRPRHHRAAWSGGYWRHSRRGYVWVPGHWR